MTQNMLFPLSFTLLYLLEHFFNLCPLSYPGSALSLYVPMVMPQKWRKPTRSTSVAITQMNTYVLSCRLTSSSIVTIMTHIMPSPTLRNSS